MLQTLQGTEVMETGMELLSLGQRTDTHYLELCEVGEHCRDRRYIGKRTPVY